MEKRTEKRANVFQVHHDRLTEGLYLRETKIDFVLEATSPEDILEIRLALIKAGGRVL